MSYFKYSKDMLRRFDTLALNYNIDTEDIEAFEEIENTLGVEIIITIRN